MLSHSITFPSVDPGKQRGGSPGGGGHVGIFCVGMCRPGLQIGTPV